MTQLTGLYLQGNQISDVSALTALVNIETVTFAGNPVIDKSPLQALQRQNPEVDIDIQVDGIRSVSFSPDGALLATASADNTVKLWDVTTQEKIATLRGHTNSVTSVAFSRDGTRLASGSFDNTVKLWDVETRENIATLEGHTHSVTSVAFSPNGALLASGASKAFTLKGERSDGHSDGAVKLWDVTTKENIATFSVVGVTSVAFSSDALLATGGTSSFDSSVKLWDVGTGENIATLGGHTDAVWSVAFSSDGTRLALASHGTVKIWNMTTRESTALVDRYRNRDDILSISLSPDGSLLAYGSGHNFSDGRVKLWDVGTRENIATFDEHTDAVWSVAFSPDGSLLATGSLDGTFSLWDVAESTHKLAKVSGDVQEGTFGSELAEPLVVEVRDQNDNPLQGVQVTFTVTAGEGKLSGKFTVEDKTTDANGRAEIALTLGQMVTNAVGVSIAGRELVEFYAIGNSPSHVASLKGVSSTFSRDGSLLASGSFDGTVKLWDVGTQEYIATLEGHTDAIWSLSFSPDGSLLATGSSDSTVKLWNVQTQESIATLEGHRWEVTSVSFSPDGSLLASESFGTIKLWDVGTQENIVTLEGGFALFSPEPDGTLLAFLSGDGIKLWDVGIQENIATLEGHTDVAWSVRLSFSLDGSLLASGSSDGTIQLWNVQTQEYIATLEGHTSQIVSMSFSPDGMLLASLSQSGVVNLWNVETKEHTTLSHGKYTEAFGSHLVSFSPDGSLLAFALGDAVALWDVKKGSLISLLEGYVFPGDTPIHFVSFSPDGSLLASGAFIFNSVKLWDVGSHITPPEREKIAEDVNGDGTVNILDLVSVASNLGATGQNAADVNADEVVDIRDLVKVAGALGNVAAAPSLHPEALAMLTAADVQKWLSQARHLSLTDLTSQRGIRFLEQLLAASTPKTTALLPNYPNPFNPETWIPYRLAEDTFVALTIYDLNGQVVRTLDMAHQVAAVYESQSKAIYWDGRNEVGEQVASGVYFYTLTAGNFTATRKMLIWK